VEAYGENAQEKNTYRGSVREKRKKKRKSQELFIFGRKGKQPETQEKKDADRRGYLRRQTKAGAEGCRRLSKGGKGGRRET